MDKRVKTLIIAIAIALVVAIASTSYAFFTISNKEGEENVIKSGTMGLHLEDGPEVGLENAIPGSSVTKIFYVENTGNVDTAYDLYLSEVVNTFVDKTDLVYTLTSNDGGYSTVGQVQAPSASAKIVDSEPIGVGDIHHYTLVLTFLEKNENQDDNQGVEFSGKIQINEYKEAGSNNNGQTCLTLLTDSEDQEDDSVCNILTDNCDLSTVGNEVRIDEEHFYVLGQQDQSHVKLLSKYNLLFGEMEGVKYIFHEETHTSEEVIIYPLSNIPTNIYSYGKQSKLATYSVWDEEHHLSDGTSCSFGGSKFSDNGPYYDVSIIKPYVDNYVSYLNSLGVNVTGRIVNDNDMGQFSCTPSTSMCSLPVWFASFYSDSFFVDYPGYYGYYLDPSYTIATDECPTCVDSINYTRPVIILEHS